MTRDTYLASLLSGDFDPTDPAQVTEAITNFNFGARLKEVWVTPESMPARLRGVGVDSLGSAAITGILLGVLEAVGEGLPDLDPPLPSNPLVKAAFTRLMTSDRGLNAGDPTTVYMLYQFGQEVQVPNFTPEMAEQVTMIASDDEALTPEYIPAYLERQARKVEVADIFAAIDAQSVVATQAAGDVLTTAQAEAETVYAPEADKHDTALEIKALAEEAAHEAYNTAEEAAWAEAQTLKDAVSAYIEDSSNTPPTVNPDGTVVLGS